MLVNCDIKSLLKDTPDKSVDLVLSDPPYAIETHDRGIGAKRKIFTEMAEWTSLDNDWYSSEILDEYVRICKFPNIFLFGGKRDVYKMLKYAEAHSHFYHIIPICKKTPIPMTDNTWLNNEYAVHIVDRKLVYTKEYNFKIPYFIVGGRKETNHPNEKDLEMVKRIIANISKEGDTIFDGFSGSGTTMIACHQLKRNFIGSELNEKYYKESIERLERYKSQLELEL